MLCTGRTANRRSRGIALLFLDHGTRRGWVVSVTSRPLFTPGKDPVPIVQEAGWAPGPVWTGVENLALTWIRSPHRPARSQSLYQLRYPAHFPFMCRHFFFFGYGNILNVWERSGSLVLNLQCRSWCTVRTCIASNTACLGAPYANECI